MFMTFGTFFPFILGLPICHQPWSQWICMNLENFKTNLLWTWTRISTSSGKSMVTPWLDHWSIQSKRLSTLLGLLTELEEKKIRSLLFLWASTSDRFPLMCLSEGPSVSMTQFSTFFWEAQTLRSSSRQKTSGRCTMMWRDLVTFMVTSNILP